MWSVALIISLLTAGGVVGQDALWPQDEASARQGPRGFYNFTYEVLLDVQVS